MTTDALRERGDSLEDAFFRNMDRELIEQLRAKKERAQQLDELAAASGIEHRDVLAALLDAGMHGEALVAGGDWCRSSRWRGADHEMDAREREAIMQAARDAGVTRGIDRRRALLSAWLDRRPGVDLLDAWKGYAAALVAELGEADAATLRGDIMKRARGGRRSGRRLPGAWRGFAGRAADARRARRGPGRLRGSGFRLPADCRRGRRRTQWPDSPVPPAGGCRRGRPAHPVAGFAGTSYQLALMTPGSSRAQREVSQGDPGETELAVVAAGPAADVAAVADADRAGVPRQLVQQALGLEALVGREGARSFASARNSLRRSRYLSTIFLRRSFLATDAFVAMSSVFPSSDCDAVVRVPPVRPAIAARSPRGHGKRVP